MKLLTGFIALFFSTIACAQTIYTWNVPSGDWGTATNWTPNRTTVNSDDILEFNGSVQATATVTDVTTENIGKLRIYNNASVNFSATTTNQTLAVGNASVAAPNFIVESGSTFTISGAFPLTITIPVGSGQVAGAMTFTGAAHRIIAIPANSLVFQSGGVFTAATGFAGNAFGNTNQNTVVFQSGSTYIAQSGANPFGLAAPNSVCTFQTGSLFSYRQSGTAPSLSGRTYANFEIDNASFNQSNMTGVNPFRCDTLTIKNANTVGFNLTGGFMIGGDFIVNSGTVSFNPASSNTIIFDGSAPQNLTGNVTFSSGCTVVVAKTSTLNLNSNIATPGSVLVYGKLNTKTATVFANDYTTYSPGTLSRTATFTVNDNDVTGVLGGGTTGITVGMEVVNANVPAGTYVTSITSGTAFRISKFATSSGSGSTVQLNTDAATLGIGSPNGITAAPTLSGNIQATTRNFIADATYEYNGTAAQVTGDGLPASFDNLVVNNYANVTLSGSITVSDALYLTLGRLIATSFGISVPATASIISGTHTYTNLPYTNIGTDSSYVVGFLSRSGFAATALAAYPVGSPTQFRPLFLKNVSGDYTVSYTQASPRVAYGITYGAGIDHVSDMEYWNLATGGASSGTVELSFYDPNSGGVTNMADLRVASWNGAQWTDLGNSATLGTPGLNGSVTATPGSVGSIVTLASSTPQNPLPLKTINLTAIKVNRNASVQWTVNADQDVQEYFLERSGDGRNFSTVHRASSIRSAMETAYRFTDMLTGERIYYRVKAALQNGRSIYSSIVLLPGDGEVIAVYPNPVSAMLQMVVPKAGGQISIINATGRLVYKANVDRSTISINVQQWAKGYYQLQFIQPGSKMQTRAFVVE